MRHGGRRSEHRRIEMAKLPTKRKPAAKRPKPVTEEMAKDIADHIVQQAILDLLENDTIHKRRLCGLIDRELSNYMRKCKVVNQDRNTKFAFLVAGSILAIGILIGGMAGYMIF